VIKNKYFFERWFVEIESYENENPELEPNKFTAYRSNSECGLFRLCLVNPREEYLQKGTNFTLSTFLFIELQLFINQIFDTLPHYETLEQQISSVKSIHSCTTLYNERKNEILYSTREKNISFQTYILDTNERLGEYNYNFEIPNYIVVPKYLMNDYNEMTIDEKRRFVADRKKVDFVEDKSIEFTNTNVNLTSTIYSIQIETKQPSEVSNAILYYMICNINIITRDNPENENPLKKRNLMKNIEEENVIIPLICIPLDIELDTNLSKYGLYTNYCMLSEFYGKILEYQQNCNRENRCSSSYSYNGDTYLQQKYITDLVTILDIPYERQELQEIPSIPQISFPSGFSLQLPSGGKNKKKNKKTIRKRKNTYKRRK